MEVYKRCFYRTPGEKIEDLRVDALLVPTIISKNRDYFIDPAKLEEWGIDVSSGIISKKLIKSGDILDFPIAMKSSESQETFPKLLIFFVGRQDKDLEDLPEAWDNVFSRLEEYIFAEQKSIRSIGTIASSFKTGLHQEATEILISRLLVWRDNALNKRGIDVFLKIKRFILTSQSKSVCQESIAAVQQVIENKYGLNKAKECFFPEGLLETQKISIYYALELPVLVHHDEGNDNQRLLERYDVFISNKSEDHKYAKRVYDFLQSNGLKVFFSDESLVKIGSTEYQRQIHEAIEHTHHMIVVGTSKKHFTSKWVEHEWQLFQGEILAGRKKGNLITIIAEEMKISDLPISLRNLEVISLNPMGLQKLLSYVEKESQRSDEWISKKHTKMNSLYDNQHLLNSSSQIRNMHNNLQLLEKEEIIHRQNGTTNELQKNLGEQATILKILGHLNSALEKLKEKERICRDADNKEDLRRSLFDQALIHKKLSDHESALKCYKEEEQICREVGDKDALHNCLGNMGLIFLDQNGLNSALYLFKEKELICRELRNKIGLKMALSNQASIYKELWDPKKAFVLYKEIELICRELHDKTGAKKALANQVMLRKEKQRPTKLKKEKCETSFDDDAHFLIDLSAIKENTKPFRLNYASFQNFLDELFAFFMWKHVAAFTYGKSWILINPVTGKHIIKQANIDTRSLKEVGISKGMHLAVKLLDT